MASEHGEHSRKKEQPHQKGKLLVAAAGVHAGRLTWRLASYQSKLKRTAERRVWCLKTDIYWRWSYWAQLVHKGMTWWDFVRWLIIDAVFFEPIKMQICSIGSVGHNQQKVQHTTEFYIKSAFHIPATFTHFLLKVSKSQRQFFLKLHCPY